MVDPIVKPEYHRQYFKRLFLVHTFSRYVLLRTKSVSRNRLYCYSKLSKPKKIRKEYELSGFQKLSEGLIKLDMVKKYMAIF